MNENRVHQEYFHRPIAVTDSERFDQWLVGRCESRSRLNKHEWHMTSY